MPLITQEIKMKVVGPYSVARKAGNLLYISGQIAEEGDIETQTRQILFQLEEVLKEHKLTAKDVVKTEIFLTNMNDFTLVNSLYAEFFSSDPKPARQCVEVSRLPKDVLIEISAIACFPEE